jgi:anaphase-promoting complex subunit 4
MAEAFSSMANVAFASQSRITHSSWCPDKDLLVVIVCVAGKDRLSLWKMQGSKIWEVDIQAEPSEASTESTIVDIAWSPDSKIYLSLLILDDYLS